jgi:hypothetical protein
LRGHSADGHPNHTQETGEWESPGMCVRPYGKPPAEAGGGKEQRRGSLFLRRPRAPSIQFCKARPAASRPRTARIILARPTWEGADTISAQL